MPEVLAAFQTGDDRLDRVSRIIEAYVLVVSRHGGAAGIARTPAAEGGGRDSFDNQLLRRICGAVTR